MQRGSRQDPLLSITDEAEQDGVWLITAGEIPSVSGWRQGDVV